MSAPNPSILARPFIESAVARSVDRAARTNADLQHACASLALFVATDPDLTDRCLRRFHHRELHRDAHRPVSRVERQRPLDAVPDV